MCSTAQVHPVLGKCCCYKAMQGEGKDWMESTLRQPENPYWFLMENFPAFSDLEQQEERMPNITLCLHRARRGMWTTRGNFLKQVSPDAWELRWKGWAPGLMFRQVTCSRIKKGAQHIQRIQGVCAIAAKKYSPRQPQHLKKHTPRKHRVKLPSCKFHSVWEPNSVQAPVTATCFCIILRGSPLPTYHPPKSTARTRYKGWHWILASDGRSPAEVESPISSIKRQFPASSFWLHHPPV